MKMVNLVPVICRNCALNRSCRNDIQFSRPILMVSSLRIFFPTFNRSFMTYTSLFRDYLQEVGNNKERNPTGSNKQLSRVSVVDPSGKESKMLLSEAEKLAKRNKMKLARLPSSRGDKVKYTLQKILDEPRKDKQKHNKKIILREETEPHDVEIKINHMLKFIDKGLDVLCVVEGSGKGEKRERVLQLLENSQLSNHLISKVLAKKSLHLLYGTKSAGKKDEPKGNNEESAEALS